MRCFAAVMALVLCGCSTDETLWAYGAAERDWHLSEWNGTSFEAGGVIRFGPKGAVSGQGPCNSFSAIQAAPYPWFDLGPLAATKRACPGLEAEQRFFEALSSMSFAEVSGDVLILTGQDGPRLVFQAKRQ